MEVKIYCLIDPITLKVRYIGRTSKSLNTRLSQHLCKLKTKEGKLNHKEAWLKSLLKINAKPFIRQLCIVEGWEESHTFERQLIAKYKERLVNIEDRGPGERGKFISKEQRLQMSIALKKYYAEGGEPTRCKPVHVYDSQGNYYNYYKSLSEASRQLNIPLGGIERVFTNNYRHSRGYQFRTEFFESLSPIPKYRKDYTSVDVKIDNKVFSFLTLKECAKYFNINRIVSKKILYRDIKLINSDAEIIFETGEKFDITRQRKKLIKVQNIGTNEIQEFESLRALSKSFNLPLRKGNLHLTKVIKYFEKNYKEKYKLILPA